MNIAVCDDNAELTAQMRDYIFEYTGILPYVFHRGEALLQSGIRFDIAFVDRAL